MSAGLVMPGHDGEIDFARRANLPRVGGIELERKSAAHSAPSRLIGGAARDRHEREAGCGGR